MRASHPFPRDPAGFLYWVFFRPLTLRRTLEGLDPPIGNALSLYARGWQEQAAHRSLTLLASFHLWVVPLLLGFGTGMLLASLGREMNWLSLAFYLALGIILSLTFSLAFSVAFLLPFSLAAALFSSGSFSMSAGILFSFALGLAYGLMPKGWAWGLVGGITYGAVFALLSTPLDGLMIGAAFLAGFFRVLIYIVEAPLAWCLSRLSAGGNAVGLWRFQPLLWDELIWFPLPRLDRHLQELTRQDQALGMQAMNLAKDSFRQSWVTKKAS